MCCVVSILFCCFQRDYFVHECDDDVCECVCVNVLYMCWPVTFTQSLDLCTPNQSSPFFSVQVLCIMEFAVDGKLNTKYWDGVVFFSPPFITSKNRFFYYHHHYLYPCWHLPPAMCSHKWMICAHSPYTVCKFYGILFCSFYWVCFYFCMFLLQKWCYLSFVLFLHLFLKMCLILLLKLHIGFSVIVQLTVSTNVVYIVSW